jgi:hypothetical protein
MGKMETGILDTDYSPADRKASRTHLIENHMAALTGDAAKVWTFLWDRAVGNRQLEVSLHWEIISEKCGLPQHRVTSAVRELVGGGFLELLRKGHTGLNSMYRIWADPFHMKPALVAVDGFPDDWEEILQSVEALGPPKLDPPGPGRISRLMAIWRNYWSRGEMHALPRPWRAFTIERFISLVNVGMPVPHIEARLGISFLDNPPPFSKLEMGEIFNSEGKNHDDRTRTRRLQCLPRPQANIFRAFAGGPQITSSPAHLPA